MANHVHLILRTRPDWVQDWDDTEVAQRWRLIFPRNGKEPKSGKKDEAAGSRPVVKDQEKLGEIRRGLSSLSWFMRCLNEHVARRANREDGCKGRFWEGRFRCQALLDEAASLACMTYVDLNPIRANSAQTPEESPFTSACERIEGRNTELQPSIAISEPTGQSEIPGVWLCPIGEEQGDQKEGCPYPWRNILTYWIGRTAHWPLGKRA